MEHIISLRRVSLCRVSLVQACTLILVSCFHSSSVATPAPPPVFGNTTDHLALLSFKSLIHDRSGALASWNSTLHFCHWRGVTCGGRRHPQRVIALDLENLDLIGTLAPSLANLTFLRRLHLPGNHLGGQLFPELGRLLQLRYLNLSSNSLVGEIPANLSRCANLRSMSIKKNMITGEIPGDLGSHARLQVLSLSVNMITGQIPSSLGNLSSLVGFYSIDNKLKGSIPGELAGIPGLRAFSVGGNMLTGTIPPSLYNISSLSVLDVAMNTLSGTLPSDILRTLPQLKVLSMYENQLGGHLPSSFPNASLLSYLDVTYNNFAGVVPSNLGALQDLLWLQLGSNQLEAADWSFLGSLANCSQLEILDFGNNFFQGTLPATVANISTQLHSLIVSNNRISGGIPSDLGKLVNLESLAMDHNLLTGTIPDTLGNLRNLTELDLSQNMLSRKIPSSLGNLTRLTRLWLYANDLEGGIPRSLRNCHSLELLDLSQNRLSGKIPGEAIGLPSLSLYLNLSHNSLNGSIPIDVSNLKNLAALDISENKLSGEIPTYLGDCQILQYLNMAGNSFQGSIPQSLSNLRGLQVMDLSHNQFSGPIPRFLQSLQLQLLNLSFNDFEGEVPTGGVFQNYSAYSILGNQKLCGGEPKLHLPRCPVQTSRKKHGPPKVTIIIILLAVLVPCFVFLAFPRYCKIPSLRRQMPSFASPNDFQHTRISYGELLRATNGFSRENLLGEGSFGSVYKGILDEGAKLVAVKVFNLQQHGASKSFMAECEALRNIRHRNLLKILTSCSGVDFQGNEFKALVFEFMANGSLESWLHGKECPNKLNFLQRLNIAIDVACALDYIHNHGETPIIHCDLKPSNILLDCDMCAHVGDFGLSRFIHEIGEDRSRNLASSIGIKGSIGYIAPEYGTGSKPYTSGDVYSYGILLLEMFTGKRPTDDLLQEGLNLHRYVEMALPTQVMNIIDPCLLLLHDEYQGANGSIQDVDNVEDRLKNCLVSVIKVGLLCSKESPEERIEMRDVVKEMYVIRDVFLELRAF